MSEPVTLDIKASTIMKSRGHFGIRVFVFTQEVVVIVFLAIVIASGVSPFANWLEEKDTAPFWVSSYCMWFCSVC